MLQIKLESISKVYAEGKPNETIALKDVSLEIKKGEFVALMGPSGSGKSTLMNMLGLLDRPSQGEYILDGENVATLDGRQRSKVRRDKVGFIFQSFNLLSRLTALENVMLPMMYGSISPTDRKARAVELLDKVGLSDRMNYRPTQLSGGQMQRVAVARSLANKPSLILADEPTGNLDSKTGSQIMDLLKDLHKEGNTLLMVTHDTRLADYTERTINITDGAIVTSKQGGKK